MQDKLTMAPAPQADETNTPVTMELGAPTTSLIHMVRVLHTKHNWRQYLESLASHHGRLSRAAKTDRAPLDKAYSGDPEALAYMLRLEVATVATLLLSLLDRASAITAFVTLDEAVAAAHAALVDVSEMDAGAVHAVLVGAGVLAEPARAVDTSRDTGGGEPPELEPEPAASAEAEPVTIAEGAQAPVEAPAQPAPDVSPEAEPATVSEALAPAAATPEADTQPPVPAEG